MQLNICSKTTSEPSQKLFTYIHSTAVTHILTDYSEYTKIYYPCLHHYAYTIIDRLISTQRTGLSSRLTTSCKCKDTQLHIIRPATQNKTNILPKTTINTSQGIFKTTYFHQYFDSCDWVTERSACKNVGTISQGSETQPTRD